jgi:RND family efflux transporter MFP subunit
MRKLGSTYSAAIVGVASLGATGLAVYLFLSSGSHDASAAGAPLAAIAPPATSVAQPAAAEQTVETVRPMRADVARTFDTNATLEAFETADLYPKVSGYLTEVRVDIGDHVKAGQVLAVISLPETEKELAEAEATVASKKADLALQRVTLDRQAGLLKIRGTSQQAYDEAKGKADVAAADADLAVATADKIRTMLSYTRIVAPFDGVVAQRLVNRGDFVQAATAGRNTPLVAVQRVDIIRIFCNVPESDVARIRAGLRATVKPFGLEGKAITGQVARFAGRLDPQSRNMRTEIDVPNLDGKLYPGMYAQVSLETEVHPRALTVPAAAVGNDPTGAFVFVVREGRIARQPVKMGISQGGTVEVVEGISEGLEILKSIQGAPAPGSAVKIAPRA